MNTDKTLKIGRSDFGLFIKNGYYLVDKTKLIYDFHNNSNDIILFPRPKRFGKTLNLSMIEYFYDIQKLTDKILFSKLEIAQRKVFCDEHQNKYPVINISLKNVKASSWKKCYEAFKSEIADLYSRHEYLLVSEKLSERDKKQFSQIINENATQTKFEFSLKHLSKYLEQHWGQKVLILVDEYDAPIISAFNSTNTPIKSEDKENKTYYEKVIEFMQGLLGGAYKGNGALFKGMITGVMRVGRESIFSEWNNFDVFGITSNYFSDNFGFTEKETGKILKDFGLENKKEEIKYWYDGYKFGDKSNIYNPWSIVNYIGKSKDGFKPYWINSGDYSLIKNRIVEIGVKDKVHKLIEGEIIEEELYDNFVFQDFETNDRLFWSLLTDNGYLTQEGKAKYDNHKLRIPNKEIKITRDLLIETADNLINNKIEEFENGFRKIVGDTLSYYDIAEKTDKQTKEKIVTNEQIYHVYTLGLLAILTDDYIIKSNKESGEGRYDIMLVPYDKNRNGVVIEIKSIGKQGKSEEKKDFIKRVNNEIKGALNQIDKNRYYTELIENKINPDNIIKLTIVFAGKEPYINEKTEKHISLGLK